MTSPRAQLPSYFIIALALVGSEILAQEFSAP